VDWAERANAAIERYEGGETRELDQRQLTQLGNAAWAAGLSLLMAGRSDHAAEWLRRAAERYRESWADAPPDSWGRPIAAMKALLLAGDDASDAARWALDAGAATAESPIGRYAGTLALLRFEYVTDEAYSGPGVGLADIYIPEIGFVDGQNGYGGWTSSGWLLTDNRVPVRFIVQVIANGVNPAVYRMPLDAANIGSLSLTAIAQPGQSVVVVVSAIAAKTSEPGGFTLQIGP